MARETARVAEPISGDKLYQQRARAAFPLLVRQAEAGETILYSDLASELGMPNPRNLNYPLGSIGQTLERLSKQWKHEVPPLQCVVINKGGLPGEGIAPFLRENFRAQSRARQRQIVKVALSNVFSYPYWPRVLDELSLPYQKPDFSAVITKAARFGGGESDEHRRLKEYVARHPATARLAANTPRGNVEEHLPSGDCIDVSFRTASEWVGVEVKGPNSPEPDLVRGFFQCVKYAAVMQAVEAAEGRRRTGRAVLVLGGPLPRSLFPLKHLLGVEVYENVDPR